MVLKRGNLDPATRMGMRMERKEQKPWNHYFKGKPAELKTPMASKEEKLMNLLKLVRRELGMDPATR